jgi:peptidoglycan/LPS O-acetylase OafA/YrhL
MSITAFISSQIQSRTFTSENKNETEVTFIHVKALDGLRAVAVLIVMFHHLELLIPENKGFLKAGYLGVDVFFVLSGFLITSVLIKEHSKTNGVSLKNFFMRRTLRLIPAYWFFLAVLYVFGNYFLLPESAEIIYGSNNFLWATLYLTNWHRILIDNDLTGNLNHTWSLAIEEQFYIFWSLVLYLAFKEKKTRSQIFNLTLIMVAVTVTWQIFRVIVKAEVDTLYYSTDIRIDALLIGCFLSFLYYWRFIPKGFTESKKFQFISFASLIISIVILFNFAYGDISLFYGFKSLFSVCIAVIILWLLTQKEHFITKILELKVLCWTGTISYPLYLWHYLCYEFTRKYFDSAYSQVAIGLTLSFILASFSYYLIEKPFLRMKTKF